MRTLLLSFLLLAPSAFTVDHGGKPTRAVLREAELRFDNLIQKQWPEDPNILLGTSRAIYIEGYGVVMTAEVNLVTGPTVSPFNPNISKESIARHRDTKLQRLPKLKELVKTGAATARTWFPEVADNDNLVVGITLLKYSWEDPAGLPSQLIATTQRKKDAAVKLLEN
jgi:hypothetical protein